MSNETKWTPGPWLRDTASGLSCDVRASSGRKVALCWGLSTTRAAMENRPGYRAECNANASLIAVAPEMYILLEAATCPSCDGSGAFYQGDGDVTQCQWCYERDAALAKARGE